MIKILFFHGYDSSPETSNTLSLLKDEFGEENIISPSYDCLCATRAYPVLNYSIIKQLDIDQELILVGTSLGGFWANYFCEKFNLKTILVNPSLDPCESLKKYQKVDLDSYRVFYVEDTLEKHKIIILGKKDDVIPYTTFLSRLNKYYKSSIFIDEDMGHRVTNPNLLIRCIKESYMNIY